MRLLLLPLAVALALPVFAQMGVQKRPMTFADLQAMKRVSDPQISPSGKWVLFSVTDVSLEKNSKVNHLWVVALGGGKEVELTSGSGETGGRFSPDGNWVMYSSRETGTSQIWMAPWDDAAGVMGAGHQVTSLETEADGGVWAPDSKHFLFVSEVYPECESHAAMGVGRNEEEVSCNALKDSIQAKSPVKATLFTSLLYRHWDHYQGSKRSHIFYGSVEAGAGAPEDLTPASVIGDRVAPTFFLGAPLGYAISPDGKEVAYVVNLDKVPAESTNNDIFVLAISADPSRAMRVSISPGSDDAPQYSPDGKYLAWRSQARNGFESDKFNLAVMDRATTTDKPGPTIKSLTENFGDWVDEFAWAPDSTSIYFASPSKGQEPIFVVKLAAPGITELQSTTYGEKSSQTSYPNFTFKAEFGSLVVAPDGSSLVASGMKVNEPASLYRFALSDFNLKTSPSDDALQSWKRQNGNESSSASAVYSMRADVIANPNAQLLDSLSLAPLEPFWFSGAADTKVEGFIIRPPGFDASKKYPVKFVMHGGPQTALGDGWSYRWNPELMAADGYVVVMINRRGSTGYGQKFVDEVSGDWGGKAYVDLMKGLDYAEKTYPFIDKDRECALGASYGGFMANWVLTHTDRFKCIVTHDGMYNPQSAFGTTEEDWFNEWEFRPAAANGVGVEQTKAAYPWDFFDKSNEEDPFRKWSPMLHIKSAKTPTLVIHGQRDYRLDVSEGLQLFDSLQMLGVPSEMLYFQDEGHWVLKPKDSELWYRTVNDWCDRWTGSNGYAAVGPAVNPMAVAAPKR